MIRRRSFQVLAHRGDTAYAPENTLAAFRHAVKIGADGVELDVRLTSDRQPAVYHYYYLEEASSGAGTIFSRTAAELKELRVKDERGGDHGIPMLWEVLSEFGGLTQLEIEAKGPEPEAAPVIANVLNQFPKAHDRIEVTSFEPALLLSVRRSCPDIATALLFPRSEPWMKLDVVGYAALQRARLAGASAVHLHPSQLSEDVMSRARSAGVEVHSWDANDLDALRLTADLGVTWIDTDRLEAALSFRNSLL